MTKPALDDVVPITIREAVTLLLDDMGEKDRAFVRDPSSDPSSCHFTAAMQMRNGWSLWEKETPLKRDAVTTYGIAHADDLSGLIYAWLWAEVRGTPFDPVKHCESYHVHWRKQGIASLYAGGYAEDGTPLPHHHGC